MWTDTKYITVKKSILASRESSDSKCEICHILTEYRILCVRMEFNHPGAFVFLGGAHAPHCRSPPHSVQESLQKIWTEERKMEVTINIDGQALSVEVTVEVLCGFISARPAGKPWATKSSVCWKMRYSRCKEIIIYEPEIFYWFPAHFIMCKVM